MLQCGLLKKVQAAFEWIAADLAGSDLSIEIELDDLPRFFAQCRPTADFPHRVCKIYIGLACVPIFVGIMNRLRDLQDSGPLMLAMEVQGEGAFDTPWDPRIDPVGRSLIYDYAEDENTTTSTAKAMLLIFFHEAAHALRGHGWIPCDGEVSQEKHRRAIESDADWSAGYLYMKYALSQVSEEQMSDPLVLEKLTHDLALASSSLVFALQVHSDTEDQSYHLPHSRSMDIFNGAEIAWFEFNVPGDFVELLNNTANHLAVIDMIVSKRLEYWVQRDDPRHAIDEQEKYEVTIPICNGFSNKAALLERGVLKGARDREAEFVNDILQRKGPRILAEPLLSSSGKLTWQQRRIARCWGRGRLSSAQSTARAITKSTT